MTTDILIVHLNGEEIIRNCLSSIMKNTQDFKVYLMLNSTTDKSEEVVRKNFPKVNIIKSEKLLGFAEASNRLAELSKSEYIVFLNNDTEVSKDWLKEMLRTIKRNKNCIACQPKVKSLKEKNKFEYAGAGGGFIDIYGYPFARGRVFDYIEEDKGQYNDERRVFWGCGVCLLVKRKDYFDIGGFDESLFMYGEETDFCWRTNIYGKEVWYSPKSVIYHIGSFSIGHGKNSLKKDYYHSRNHLILLIKNYSAKNLIKIMPVRILLEAISAVRFFPNKTLASILTLITLPFYYFTYLRKQRKKIQLNRSVKDEELFHLFYMKSIALSHFLGGKNKFSEIKLG